VFVNGVNQAWLVAERVLAEGPGDDGALQYLIKWRGLEYDKCSWERGEDLRRTAHFPEALAALRARGAITEQAAAYRWAGWAGPGAWPRLRLRPWAAAAWGKGGRGGLPQGLPTRLLGG
jgi:hypothetical protein